jgi:hypothetical protein
MAWKGDGVLCLVLFLVERWIMLVVGLERDDRGVLDGVLSGEDLVGRGRMVYYLALML